MRGCAIAAGLCLVPLLAAGPDMAVLSGNFGAAQPMRTRLRVLDWNVDKGKRLDRIIQTVRDLRPDLVLIQEVDLYARRTGRRNKTEDLAQAVRMNYIFGRSFEELSQGSGDQPAYLGQAILTNLPVRSSRVLPFQRQTRFWKPEPFLPSWSFLQRRLGGRVALVAEFGTAATELAVYNLHLESRGFGATRLGQLDEVIADSRRYGDGVTVVIAGDLNSKYAAGRYESKLKQAGFRSCFARRVRTHRLTGTLDWLMVRGPGACEEARVVRGTKGSDHDALFANIIVRGG